MKASSVSVRVIHCAFSTRMQWLWLALYSCFSPPTRPEYETVVVIDLKLDVGCTVRLKVMGRESTEHVRCLILSLSPLS